MDNKIDHHEIGRLGGLASAYSRQQLKEKRVKKYNETPKKCPQCHENIPYEKRRHIFCSRSCVAKYYGFSKKVDKPEDKYCYEFLKIKTEYPLCLCCRAEIKKYSKVQKYCSYKCRRQYEWDQRKLIIEESGKMDADGPCSPKIAKKYLIEKLGHKCSICSKKTWNKKPIPLVLDHISGDASDWNLSNLRLVCGNCNMQLPTFAGRNLGKGRASRRSFYKEHGYS